MEAVKIMVNRTGTGFRPLTKSTLPASTGSHQIQRAPRAVVDHRRLLQVEQIDPIVTNQKTRVCCYCRVSTLLDNQETSIEGQREHYEAMIKGNPEWEFAGIYLEVGASGTKAEIRPELQRLISDCKAGKIDLILTKSISRFARNTSDCLEMVRELTSLGVAIHFEKEQIHTDQMHSEFMLSILACLAEDESRSISGNMKWSIRKRFQDGTYKQSIPPYGYQWIGEELKVVPAEAEVVKKIFSMSLEGVGCTLIAKELNRKAIPSPRGERWTQGTLRNILSNPAYKGDALYQKSYVDENFCQKINHGELDQYYGVGHHEPIICQEDFEKAQAVMGHRAEDVGYDGKPQRRGMKRYCFSGILFCAECGAVLHRQVRKNRYVSWHCYMHSMHPNLCSMKPQSDEDLKRAFINCLNKLAWSQHNRKGILDAYEMLLGKAEAEKNAEKLQEIGINLEANQKEMQKLNAIIMRDRFLPEHREKKMQLTKKMQDLLTEKNSILISAGSIGTIKELKSFVRDWRITDELAAFPEKIFTQFIKRCSVQSGKTVTFQFHCGLELTESLYPSALED